MTPADDMKIQKEAQAWVVRLESGFVSTDDARAFRAWCSQSREHATSFSEARKIWVSMGEAARNERFQSSKGADARSAYLRPSFGRRAFLGGAVAASVTYLAVRPPLDLWPSMGELAANFAADYQTTTGEQRTVSTASGMLVQMNTQTRLNVDVLAGKKADVELLNGEAEFDTNGIGANMVVVASSGVMSARRARFNVRYLDGDVCVTCASGVVEVNAGQRNAVLAAGQQLIYGDGTFSKPTAVNTTVATAWRQRVLIFNQATLASVVNEVNRYRPGKLVIRGEELARQHVQASFSLDRLDDVIALVRDVYGASVTKLPGGIVVLRQA